MGRRSSAPRPAPYPTPLAERFARIWSAMIQRHPHQFRTKKAIAEAVGMEPESFLEIENGDTTTVRAKTLACSFRLGINPLYIWEGLEPMFLGGKEEVELFALFHRLPEDDRRALLSFARYMVQRTYPDIDGAEPLSGAPILPFKPRER